jgi:hypothetical protein
MPNAKTEHSINLRKLHAKQRDTNLINNGELKIISIRLNGSENIAKFNDIPNKSAWIIEKLNEQGEIK